jgi:hypothetical protein
MKNIKKHPTHFKATSYIGGLLLVLALGSFVVGIYFQQKGQIESSHTFALSFLVNTVLLISWLFFRMKLCKCPSCGKWLSKLASGDKLKSRKFICPKCNIIWDTDYVMYFESDDPG